MAAKTIQTRRIVVIGAGYAGLLATITAEPLVPTALMTLFWRQGDGAASSPNAAKIARLLIAGGLLVYAAAVLARRMIEAMPGGHLIARWLPG